MTKQPPLSTNLSRWQWRHWLVVIGTLLVATLAPLGWIQWQQTKLLNELSNNQVDSLIWQAYQLERELSRLEQITAQALRDPGTVDPFEMQSRYEVFLSRLNLLTDIPRRDLLESSGTLTQTTEAIGRLSGFADPLFAEPEKLLASPEQLRALDERFMAVLPGLAELTREANRANARFLDERNAQLKKQSVLVISLTAVQAAVMLLFVGLLVLHIRRQARRYVELKTLSEELATARDQAEAANHGKTVFLANMSHEIRTPFQGLLGMLTLLDEPNLSARQRDYLQTARDSAMHLLGVLNDILDVSTMESGTLKLSLTPVPLHNVVQEVDDLMQVAALDKGLVLRIEAASDLPEWVMADATRVRQILYNLINNAIKFTPQGSVSASVTRGAPGQPSVVMTVRDTGVGMDVETVRSLFTRFYQADNSLRRRIGGAGLGLEISRNLARMMGGDIRVASEPGVGSVFTVTLDLTETSAPEALHSLGMGLGPSRSLRVLVAEDHPINLKYMSILLERMGHEAVFCENGQEALQLLARQPFDVVLLDYHMPVLDGLATTEAIRQLAGDTAHIPVILVTADVVNDTRKRALEVGVSAFASKPLQGDDLRQALRECGLLEIGAVGEADAPLSPASTPLAPAHAPASPGKRMVSREEVIDDASYDEICDMMPNASMHEMLDTLFAAPEGTVPQLLAALASGDRADIHYKAHTLKGTAMLLGFRALAKTAARIEHLSTEPVGPRLPAALSEQLVRDMSATQEALCETVEPPAA